MHIYYGESISLTKNNSKENMIEIFWSDLVTSYSQAKESISSLMGYSAWWRRGMLIHLNGCSASHPLEWSLSYHVVQVVNEYPCGGERRLRLCTRESGTSRTSVHNGSVQHCCDLCKSTKLNIIKAKFFFKDLDSHCLSRCTTSLLCSRTAFFLWC